MKKLLFAFLLISQVSKAQTSSDIIVPVQELNIADTAFNLHPNVLLVRMQSLNASFDTALVYVETSFQSKNIDSSIYISQETYTRSYVRIPLAAFKAAVLPDGTLVPDVINTILLPFKLRMK